MSVAKKRTKRPVPEFRTEDEERKFWAGADSTDYVDWDAARKVVLPKLKPTQKSDLAETSRDDACRVEAPRKQERCPVPVFIEDIPRGADQEGIEGGEKLRTSHDRRKELESSSALAEVSDGFAGEEHPATGHIYL